MKEISKEVLYMCYALREIKDSSNIYCRVNYLTYNEVCLCPIGGCEHFKSYKFMGECL